jgi:hypothetical protein
MILYMNLFMEWTNLEQVKSTREFSAYKDTTNLLTDPGTSEVSYRNNIRVYFRIRACSNSSNHRWVFID